MVVVVRAVLDGWLVVVWIRVHFLIRSATAAHIYTINSKSKAEHLDVFILVKVIYIVAQFCTVLCRLWHDFRQNQMAFYILVMPRQLTSISAMQRLALKFRVLLFYILPLLICVLTILGFHILFYFNTMQYLYYSLMWHPNTMARSSVVTVVHIKYKHSPMWFLKIICIL